MQLLHPIFHSNSYEAGSRIDIDRELPRTLEDEEELDYLLDSLSEPPMFIDRISPLNVQLGQDIINGKNWTDLMAKSYRIFSRVINDIAAYITQTLIDNFDEKGMVPFMSFGIDPDTFCRILDIDFETGESTYIRILNLYSNGMVAPCITIPFNVLLPTLEDEHEVRMLIRIGILFYWNILKQYHKYLQEEHGEKEFMVNVWLPEGGYNERIIQILFDEIRAKCSEEKIKNPHLVFLLDNEQADDEASDVIMKSWNVLNLNGSKNSAASVVFKNRHFSDWINRATPSVKKLIDRTIAKNDAELNDQETHYCWAHFENIESLAKSPKSIGNFEQKIIKLTELGYLSLSPDMFVRRKRNKQFTHSEEEPRKINLINNTGWLDWHSHNVSLGRWEGTLDSNVEFKLVDENRPYERNTMDGNVEELGPQCWKIAFNKAIRHCGIAVRGDSKSFDSGMLGVLASLVPSKDKKLVRKNVEDFLVHYACIHWREHFLHQGFAEADIFIIELVEQYLFRDTGELPTSKDCVIAALAAQAYYFSMDGTSSIATAWENMDQRMTYQNVLMMTLAVVDAIYIYRRLDMKDEEKELFDTFKTDLLEFHDAYERYQLAQYGVTHEEWEDALKSNIEDCDMNVVERAAYCIAARHLRPIGYRDTFTRDHQDITCNTGHIWSSEIDNTNYRWENTIFCGIREE